MLKFRTIALLAVGLALALSAGAQELKISTGDAKGSTYVSMMKDIDTYCGTTAKLSPVNSTGSVENLERLVGNQVNGAFVQADMLFRRGQTEDLSAYLTFMALHPEQAHYIVRAASGLKTGKTLGMGGTDVVFTDLVQLAGYHVGAAGGSAVSASIIKLQSDVNYVLDVFPDNKAALAALDAGTVQAVLLMGGAPLPSVTALKPGAYRLLAISPATQTKLAQAYKPARANYANLGAAGTQTISTDALLVVKNYKSAPMVAALTKLRSCLTQKLDEIKETTGTHPAWNSVVAGNKGPWPFYSLPGDPK